MWNARGFVLVTVALLAIAGCRRQPPPVRLAVVSAQHAPELPAGVAKRAASEELRSHELTTTRLAFDGALRVTWSTFSRGNARYIEDVKIVSTTPVRADLRIDFGTPDTVAEGGAVVHVARFATTWVNRRGALVHDYFEVLGDGSTRFLGTYCD